MYFKDLREYIGGLEKQGLLYRVGRKVCKDTELMPMVRWQYRGLPESSRKGFVFESVTDAKGREYDAQVAVSILGASEAVYAAALQADPKKITEIWNRALDRPLDSVTVDKSKALCKEHIHKAGDGIGLDEFPVPISLPGFDPAPFVTAPYVITKDPETGVRNVGTYRMMLKGPWKTGLHTGHSQHIAIHAEKCLKLGKKLEVAVVLGAVPAVGLASVAKVPYGMDEVAVAGALAGEPIPVVKCETVDLEVPATAEIILEGVIDPNYLEPEGPHGESRGYVSERNWSWIFNITCITHRKRPIVQCFMSQFPPSESSVVKRYAHDSLAYRLLKHDLGITSLKEVVFNENVGSREMCVIQLSNPPRHEVWRALMGICAMHRIGKIVVAVDDDIDPHDADSVNFALCTRMQPHLDAQIINGKTVAAEVATAPPESLLPKPRVSSALLIDATRKWHYPPLSLPGKEYMEKAKTLWEECGLPALAPHMPWHGYDLGWWSPTNREEAKRAVAGRYYETGDDLSKRGMNDQPKKLGGRVREADKDELSSDK